MHVSQISNEWLENPVTALQVGQEVTAKIMEINVEREKMNLSIKALLPEAPKPEKAETKGKKGKKEEVQAEDVELHEWKEETSTGVS
ncbi:MAG: S1 RNA-binding domain-containing protein, partial [Clostridia bacterium]|nr:S1 RNA-binding domain-containing protein [Clostridia bacterium]